MYLYLAIDFYLSKCRNKQAAKRFFKKALAFSHVSMSCVITVDKNPAYPITMHKLKEDKKMPKGIQIRQVKYLNNIVEQDHRFIKKRIYPMLGLKSFCTVKAIISGIEAMHMIKKKPVFQEVKSVQNQKGFILCINFLV